MNKEKKVAAAVPEGRGGAEKDRRSPLHVLFGAVLAALAVCILVAGIMLPAMRVTGTGMAPTLTPGSIVLTLKGPHGEAGDLVAVQVNGRLVARRVIASGGETVSIAEDGIVSVSGKRLDEPYLKGQAVQGLTGEYQVPEGQLFLMGDNREEAVDSRHAAMGCVPEEMVSGRILLCIWPLNQLNFF